jgi:hypothetical protein
MTNDEKELAKLLESFSCSKIYTGVCHENSCTDCKAKYIIAAGWVKAHPVDTG